MNQPHPKSKAKPAPEPKFYPKPKVSKPNPRDSNHHISTKAGPNAFKFEHLRDKALPCNYVIKTQIRGPNSRQKRQLWGL